MFCFADVETRLRSKIKMNIATLERVFKANEGVFVALVGAFGNDFGRVDIQNALDDHYAKMFQIINEEFPNDKRRQFTPLINATTPNKAASKSESGTPIRVFSTPKKTIGTPSVPISCGKRMTQGGVSRLFTSGSRGQRKRAIVDLNSSGEDSSEGEAEKIKAREELENNEPGALSMSKPKPRNSLGRGRRSSAVIVDEEAMWKEMEKAEDIRFGEESPSKKPRSEKLARELTLRSSSSIF
jgi:hypothetical protein